MKYKVYVRENRPLLRVKRKSFLYSKDTVAKNGKQAMQKEQQDIDRKARLIQLRRYEVIRAVRLKQKRRR